MCYMIFRGESRTKKLPKSTYSHKHALKLCKEERISAAIVGSQVAFVVLYKAYSGPNFFMTHYITSPGTEKAKNNFLFLPYFSCIFRKINMR